MDKLARTVAGDWASDWIGRLRGQSEIGFNAFAWDNRNWGSGRNVRAGWIIDNRETQGPRMRRTGCNRLWIRTGPRRQIIRAGLKLRDAELSIFIRRAARAILPNLAAVFQALDHELHGQVCNGFAVVSGDPAIDDAFVDDLDNRR